MEKNGKYGSMCGAKVPPSLRLGTTSSYVSSKFCPNSNMVSRRDLVWVDFWDLSSFSHSLLLLVCIITNYC